MSLYARLYWYAAQRAGGIGVFYHHWPDWPSMKAGIHVVIARYPDNWNLNNFARYACAAGDFDESERLIDQIEWPLMEIWEDYKTLHYCHNDTPHRAGPRHPRVRTHKRDSLWSSTVIQVLNDGERIGVGTFLADEGAIRGT